MVWWDRLNPTVAGKCWRHRHHRMMNKSSLKNKAHAKTRSMKNVVFSILVLMFTADAVRAGGAEKIEGYLDGLETFSAGFEQSVFNEYGEVLETSTGKVYLRRPGMFRWSYREPYAQEIISDGITLWVYDKDLEQITIRDVVNSIDQTPAAIFSNDVELEQQYVVVELGGPDNLEWFELTPRDIESQYSSLRLAFRGDEPAEMMLFDNLGRKTQIVFQEPQRNPADVERSLFDFTPPDGVDVIDTRPQ